MFAGLFVTLYGYFNTNNNCPDVKASTALIGLIIYFSYLLLFVQFFVRAYLYGFQKAMTVTSGKTSRKTTKFDENANRIDDKKTE